MADSIREQIIQDIVTQLGTLSGYGDVHRGLIYFESGDLPAIAVLPGVETAEKKYGEQFCVMPVAVHAIQVIGSGNNPSVVGEVALADLIDNLIGGRDNIDKVNNITYAGGGIEDYPDENEQAIVINVNIDVEYCTNLGDPFTQTSI